MLICINTTFCRVALLQLICKSCKDDEPTHAFLFLNFFSLGLLLLALSWYPVITIIWFCALGYSVFPHLFKHTYVVPSSHCRYKFNSRTHVSACNLGGEQNVHRFSYPSCSNYITSYVAGYSLTKGKDLWWKSLQNVLLHTGYIILLYLFLTLVHIAIYPTVSTYSMCLMLL